MRTSLLLPVLLVSALAACSSKEETVTPRDNCKIRDCGPASGGDADPLPEDDADEFDEGLPWEDTAFVVSDGAAEASASDAKSDVRDTAVSCPETASCTTFPQCGCAADQACERTSAATTACVMAGTKKLHERCNAPGECAKGFTCIDVLSVCVPFCGATSDCVGVNAADCRLQSAPSPSGDGGSADVPGSGFCASQCNPVAPNQVCGTANCDFWDIDKQQTVCTAAGSGTTTGACKTDLFACAAGYTCVGDDCRQWCRIGFAGDCAAGKTCTTFSNHPKVGNLEYGYCPP